MTYIQPHQNNKINFLIFTLTLASAGIAVWGVFLYNQLIDLRHEVSTQGKNVNQLEVGNAELKNNFYQALDSADFESLTKSKAFIVEKNPEYIKLNGGQSLTASR